MGPKILSMDGTIESYMWALIGTYAQNVIGPIHFEWIYDSVSNKQQLLYANYAQKCANSNFRILATVNIICFVRKHGWFCKKYTKIPVNDFW